MSIDFHVVNTVLLTLATIAGMVTVFVVRKHIGFAWFVIIIEVILSTLLIRRIDVIGLWFGLDIISADINDFIISWVVIVTLFISIWKILQRRAEINEIEVLHKKQVARLAEHEARMEALFDWSNDAEVTHDTEELNTQILQALK